MQAFLQNIINGLAQGSVYALVALGYTMVYGVLQFINFAHSDIFMLGAFAGIYLTAWLTFIPYSWLTMTLVMSGAMIFCVLVALIVERVAYRPLRNAPRLAPLITAIGLSIVLQQVAILIWGRNYISFPPILSHDTLSIFGASITKLQVVIVITCLALMTVMVTIAPIITTSP